MKSRLTTPENIRTLQRKLYHKAKQEKAYRFYALYDKIYRADILSHAYNLVRANKGSAGIDGITFEVIEAEEGTAAFLAELEEALKSKTCRPDPVKRVMIPKSNGDRRPLGIPTIRDRVAQMAVKYIFGYPANQETSTPWAVIGNLSNNQFSAAIWSLKH